jgi:glycosyltransferase involved in cell wall biosynthesis
MRLLVCTILKFPSKAAHLVYHLNQGWELARRGVEVVTWLRPLGPLPSSRLNETLAEYGLSPNPRWQFRILHFKNKPLAGLEFWLQLLIELVTPGQKVFLVPANLRIAYGLIRLRRWLRFRHPLIYEVHNLDHVIRRDRGGSGHARLQKREAAVYANADGLVVISDPLLARMRESFPKLSPHLVVLPEGVRPSLFGSHGERYEPPHPIGPDDPVQVVYAGSLYAFKGVSVVLESLRFLPDRVRLRLIGGHPEEALVDLEQKARRWGLDRRVEFVGSVPHTQIGKELIQADILALPLAADPRSIHFTSPIKLFEYLFAGRPMVVTDFPTTRSIIGDEECCVFVSDPSPQAFAKAIAFLVDHPSTAHQMALRARLLGERYTWQVRAGKLLAFLESSLKSATSP